MSSDAVTVDVRGVTKAFRRPRTRVESSALDADVDEEWTDSSDGPPVLTDETVSQQRRWRRSLPVVAVDDVSLSVTRGHGVALLGPLGSGKTTLVRLIKGVLVPDSGTVRVAGRVVGPGTNIGGSPDLTITETAYLNARYTGLSRHDATDVSQRAVEKAGLADARDTPYRFLSIPLRRRVAFATVTLSRPPILAADDDLFVGGRRYQNECKREYVKLKEAGTTFVLQDGKPERLADLCEEGLVLDRGRVHYVGPLDEAITVADSLPDD